MLSWSNWGGSIISSFSRICVFMCVCVCVCGGGSCDWGQPACMLLCIILALKNQILIASLKPPLWRLHVGNCNHIQAVVLLPFEQTGGLPPIHISEGQLLSSTEVRSESSVGGTRLVTHVVFMLITCSPEMLLHKAVGALESGSCRRSEGGKTSETYLFLET